MAKLGSFGCLLFTMSSGTEINLFFKWNTNGGSNHSFRIGTPLSFYSFTGSDEMVIIGEYLLINLPAGNVIESGSGTISSDVGIGYIAIKTPGGIEYHSLTFGNFATSAPRVNVTCKIDKVPSLRRIYSA